MINRNGLKGRTLESIGRRYADHAIRTEHHHSSLERKQRVIASQTDMKPRSEAGAALTDDDRAGSYDLSTVSLDTQPLRITVAAVFTASLRFCVCHLKLLATRL